MTRRLGRHWRRDLRGGCAIDVPGGSCGALRGWDRGGGYGSVIRLGERGLEGRIGWSVGDGLTGKMEGGGGGRNVQLLLAFRCRGWVGVGRGWGAALVLGVGGRGLSGCCRLGGLGWMHRAHPAEG